MYVCVCVYIGLSTSEWMDSFKIATGFSLAISVHPADEGACDVAFELNQLRKAILSSDHQMRMAVVLCVSPRGCAEWRPS